MAGLKLKTITRTQGNNQPHKNGTVKPRTFAFCVQRVGFLNTGYEIRELAHRVSRIAHRVSRISHRASRIPHPVSRMAPRSPLTATWAKRIIFSDPLP
jgi:hypothetical protein